MADSGDKVLLAPGMRVSRTSTRDDNELNSPYDARVEEH